jgi:hypothetical protein
LISLAEQFEHQSQTTVVGLAAIENLGPEALFLAHRHLYEQMAHDPLPNLLFQQFVSMSTKFPEVAEALDHNQQNWVGVIKQLLDKAVEDGYFRPFDTQKISEAISALYRGTCTTRYEDPERAYKIVEYTCKFVYDTVVTDKRKEELAKGAGA